VVREFVVKLGCERDFAIIFGSDGMWCGLLRRYAAGFLVTELQWIGGRRFRVKDYWSSHLKFEAFREWRQHEVEQFRDWLTRKEVVEHETVLGSFYVDDSDWDEGAGLVSA
jgi:hypothetical protein